MPPTAKLPNPIVVICGHSSRSNPTTKRKFLMATPNAYHIVKGNNNHDKTFLRVIPHSIITTILHLIYYSMHTTFVLCPLHVRTLPTSLLDTVHSTLERCPHHKTCTQSPTQYNTSLYAPISQHSNHSPLRQENGGDPISHCCAVRGSAALLVCRLSSWQHIESCCLQLTSKPT